MKKDGFSLIELMIAVAILGVLALIAVPKFADMVIKAKEAAVLGHLGSIRSAFAIYSANVEGEFSQAAVMGDGWLDDALTAGGLYLNSIPMAAFPAYRGDPDNNPGSAQHLSGGSSGPFDQTYPHPPANGITLDYVAAGLGSCEACCVNQSCPWLFNPRDMWIRINCEHMNSRNRSWTTY